jgi:class 3 adenylate cyclase/selenocysteine lyase/cysteine desulfurase
MPVAWIGGISVHSYPSGDFLDEVSRYLRSRLPLVRHCIDSSASQIGTALSQQSGEFVSDLAKTLGIPFLLALRDAMAQTLGVSVTFLDESGLTIQLESTPLARRYVSDVCQHYFFNASHPSSQTNCLAWDEQAIAALRSGGRPPSTCWQGFRCAASEIRHGDRLFGYLFYGERRVTGVSKSQQQDQMHATALATLKPDLLDPASLERFEQLYRESWDKTKFLSRREWSEIEATLDALCQLLGSLLVHPSAKSGDAGFSVDLCRSLLASGGISSPGLLAILLNGLAVGGNWYLEFLDPDVTTDPVSTSPTKRELVAIFADIRGFTDFCEMVSDREQIEVRNRLLGSLAATIKRFGGIVDKFLGDAVLALFLIPQEAQIVARNRTLESALRCALELSTTTQEYEGGMLAVGVGLTFGDAMVGSFEIDVQTAHGPTRRREYTAIGSVVNRAQRLSSLARKYSALRMFEEAPALILDDTTKGELQPVLKAKFEFPYVEEVRLKGFGDTYSRVFTAAERGEEFKQVPRAGKMLYLSYGTIAPPSQRTLDAMADYQQLMRVGERVTGQENTNPARFVANLVGTLLGAGGNNLAFRTNTTSCIGAALEFIDAASDSSRGVTLVTTDCNHPVVDAVLEDFQILHSQRWTLAPRVRIDELLTKTDDALGPVLTALRSGIAKLDSPWVLVLPHIVWDTGATLLFEKIASELIGHAARPTDEDSGFIVIDGAHGLGHVPIDLEHGETAVAAPVHFYATCAHKWLQGPEGIGILWANLPRLEKLPGYARALQHLALYDTLSHVSGIGARGNKPQTPSDQRGNAAGLNAAAASFDERRRRRTPDGPSGSVDHTARLFRNSLQAYLKEYVRFVLPPSDGPMSGILTFTINRLDLSAHRDIVSELLSRRVHVDLVTNPPKRPAAIRVSLPTSLTEAEVYDAVQEIGVAALRQILLRKRRHRWIPEERVAEAGDRVAIPGLVTEQVRECIAGDRLASGMWGVSMRELFSRYVGREVEASHYAEGSISATDVILQSILMNQARSVLPDRAEAVLAATLLARRQLDGSIGWPAVTADKTGRNTATSGHLRHTAAAAMVLAQLGFIAEARVSARWVWDRRESWYRADDKSGFTAANIVRLFDSGLIPLDTGVWSSERSRLLDAVCEYLSETTAVFFGVDRTDPRFRAARAAFVIFVLTRLPTFAAERPKYWRSSIGLLSEAVEAEPEDLGLSLGLLGLVSGFHCGESHSVPVADLLRRIGSLVSLNACYTELLVPLLLASGAARPETRQRARTARLKRPILSLS